MLLNLRYSVRDLLAAFQLEAYRAQGKGDFFDLGAHVLTAPLAAVQLAPGYNKRVNVRLQSIRKHGQLTLAVDTVFLQQRKLPLVLVKLSDLGPHGEWDGTASRPGRRKQLQVMQIQTA